MSLGHPFLFSVAEGNVSGHTVLKINGHNDSIAAGDTLLAQGGNITYLSSAATFNIGSSSSQDHALYTGASTVTIFGLDYTWAKVSETLTMDGATAVETTQEFLRVYKVEVTTAGSGGKNAGAISFRANGTAQGTINAGNNKSTMGVYTVATASEAYLVGGYYSATNNKASEGKFYVRPFGEVFRLELSTVSQDSGVSIDFQGPFKMAAKTDIEIRGQAVGGSGVASAAMFGWEEDT